MIIGKLLPRSLKRYVRNIIIKSKNNSLRLSNQANVAATVFGDSNIVFKDATLNNVTLGDFTYIGEKSVFLNTVIGKYCSIAGNVKCGLGTHPSRTFVSSHPVFYSLNPILSGITFADKQYFDEYSNTTIGNDVWIGENAMIIGGINIGDGAIIAGGALVTKDVPPYAIVGGVPAKILKYRFEEEEVQFLLKLKWWELDKTIIKNNFILFHDIKTLMKSSLFK